MFEVYIQYNIHCETLSSWNVLLDHGLVSTFVQNGRFIGIFPLLKIDYFVGDYTASSCTESIRLSVPGLSIPRLTIPLRLSLLWVSTWCFEIPKSDKDISMGHDAVNCIYTGVKNELGCT